MTVDAEKVDRSAEFAAAPGAQASEQVTGRSLVLGVLTIAGMVLYVTYFGRSLSKTYLPVAAMLPFAAWVGANILLKILFPRVALTRTEMLTILSMLWVVGNLPGIGWASYMVTDLAAPEHFASPENRARDLLIPLLPDWLFPEPSPIVISSFFTGLRPGDGVPWLAWIRPLFWWLVACLALVGAGFFGSVLFYRQWRDKERLVFPMAAFPTALLEGPRDQVVPDLFKDRVFWIGFGLAAGIIGWNIVGYFRPSIPRISLFDTTVLKAVTVGRYYPDYYTRVQPMIMGLAYLCPLDVLFSFWVYNLLQIYKVGVLNRTGFSVGRHGQAASGGQLTTLESHGALVFLVGWSVWLSRRHLKETVDKARSRRREDDDGLPVSYRTAWLGLTFSAVILGGWCVSAGMGFFSTLAQLLLMFTCYFGIAKYAATTGFTFLSPAGGKGAAIMTSLVGTVNTQPSTQTALWLVNSNCIGGVPIRTASIPSVSHFFQMMGDRLKRHPLVWGCVPVAFLSGFALSAGLELYRCYTEGALNGLAPTYDWRQLIARTPFIEGSRQTYFDFAKAGIWFLGFAEAGLLTYLRAKYLRFPFHPAAIAFPTRRYGFSLMLVWMMKRGVISYGGGLLYRRTLPFWYGAILGYLFGIGCSGAVDAIWFPGEPHTVHNW